jgi:hypothetical protein
MAIRWFNWVRFIVERPGQEALEHERRWPPLSELPKPGDDVEIPEMQLTGNVTRVVRSGAKLYKVFVVKD